MFLGTYALNKSFMIFIMLLRGLPRSVSLILTNTRFCGCLYPLNVAM